MNTLKESFTSLKKSLPAHVQWLLLAAAFLIVVILLVLLLEPANKGPAQKSTDTIKAALKMDPSEIEWRDVAIGDSRTVEINITSTVETGITDVTLHNKIPNLSLKSTCKTMGNISAKVPCKINLEWKPTAELKDTGTEIQIKYHAAAQPATMEFMERIPILLSAKQSISKSKSQKPAEKIPAKIDNPAGTSPQGKESTGNTSVSDTESPFAFDAGFGLDYDSGKDKDMAHEPVQPTPKPLPTVPTAPRTDPVKSAAPAQTFSAPNDEDCFEFAFPGYNLSGKQAGWIRAARGHYYYHVFSDETCEKPIGEYNPATGLIADIGNPSKTIGSDVEHIGVRGLGGLSAVPTLSNPIPARPVNRARQLTAAELSEAAYGGAGHLALPPKTVTNRIPSSVAGGEAVVSSDPYDRRFVLRQYKPIPATIVSEVRADINNLTRLPVQATIDRHVYSDDDRTIILPAGTLMLGYVTGNLPGPYKTIGRMQIQWYRFIRPDKVEFNFSNSNQQPFSADSQGRTGVPGRGSTDYIENMIMPMLTAVVPAAVNLIAPISDRFVNQIDLDNNTVTQSGQVRSSELAKQEIVSTWNRVVQKLAIDMLDNTTPPFSIAAGTRITVFSPMDLVVNFCKEAGNGTEECSLSPAGYAQYTPSAQYPEPDYTSEEWLGQVRSLDLVMKQNADGSYSVDPNSLKDPRMKQLFTSMNQYQSKTMAQQNAYHQNQVQQAQTAAAAPNAQQTYNEQVLGLKYNDQGQIQNPFAAQPKAAPAAPTILCPDTQTPPDADGCCVGETLTPMDEAGMNCCPDAGGDCFPPIK
ncbi:MAG: hypothetical protein LBK26_00180 [Rickettsiales bacterium]|jgi:hypothetical protein|nr:hypothetical protein [Rickettsiales bacterium]